MPKPLACLRPLPTPDPYEEPLMARSGCNVWHMTESGSVVHVGDAARGDVEAVEDNRRHYIKIAMRQKALEKQFAAEAETDDRSEELRGEQADRVLGRSSAGPLAALRDEQDSFDF